jgi:hypothetical protein
MPSISDANTPVTSFPNEFTSPFGNDGVTPLYSAVPLKSPGTGCLPCVVCGNSTLIDAAPAAVPVQGKSSVGAVLTSWLVATKVANATVAVPQQDVLWTVNLTNQGTADTGAISVATTFGGASLVSSNYTYSSGAFSVTNVPAGQTVTLTYTTQMPWNMTAPVADTTTVPGYGLLQGVVANVTMSPSAFVFTGSVNSDWGTLGNWTNLAGTAATTLPGPGSDVYLRWQVTGNSAVSSGNTLVNRVIVQPPIGVFVTITGLVLQCANGLYLTNGSTVGNTDFYGDLFLYGACSVGTMGANTMHGDVTLRAGARISAGITVDGNVTLYDNSFLAYYLTVNGNVTMYDSSYHDPGSGGGDYLTINGNLDAYYPVPRPVVNVTVSGTTTYHNYP